MRIFSVPNLKLGMEKANVPFNDELSPYCWLHNLLKKHHRAIDNLEDYGVYTMPAYEEQSLEQLCEQIEKELLLLCEAHFDRYFEAPNFHSGNSA